MSDAVILDGRATAAALAEPLARRCAAVARRRGHPVGLGVILVGEHPASAIYVRNKVRVATAAGMASRVTRLAEDSTQAQVLQAIAQMNEDPCIDAFLLQLPLPPQIDKLACLHAVLPHKDADGLHPNNIGRAALGLDGPKPCTPLGCMQLLAQRFDSLAGLDAVVIGRSTIVGQPMAQMLSQADATVTLCHARTQRLAEHVRRADILVVAAGAANLVQGDWLKPGVCIIDVGINRVGSADGKVRLVGDVDFAAACKVASAITPVPGGVGPMTLAMLLENAVCAAEKEVS